MNSQMTRVISSPSSSTIGFTTLILSAMRRAMLSVRLARMLEQPAGVDRLGHLLRAGAVGRSVLEFDYRQPVLPSELDHVLAAAARQDRLLDHLVFDALVVERLLDLPTVVEIVVNERERAAMKLHRRHRRPPSWIARTLLRN